MLKNLVACEKTKSMCVGVNIGDIGRFYGLFYERFYDVLNAFTGDVIFHVCIELICDVCAIYSECSCWDYWGIARIC